MIIEAIKNRKPISFTIRKADHVPGVRVGNPHAIFLDAPERGMEKIYVHVYRTSGVITDGNKPLPSWRLYIVSDLEEIKVFHSEESFTPAPGYNHNYNKYSRAIAKV